MPGNPTANHMPEHHLRILHAELLKHRIESDTITSGYKPLLRLNLSTDCPPGATRIPWNDASWPSLGEEQERRCFHVATIDLKASDDGLARLRNKYPGWHIWMSQARRCGHRERAAFRLNLAGIPMVDDRRRGYLRRPGQTAARAGPFRNSMTIYDFPPPRLPVPCSSPPCASPSPDMYST